MAHRRAKLTPFGRLLLVQRVEVEGWAVARAAEALGVSRATGYKWIRRHRAEGLAGLEDRSSAPGHRPHALPPSAVRDLVAERVKQADLVICTAAVPGRTAPVLVTAQMVRDMKPGSVIVDMAAETGGNCELTKPGDEIVEHGVTIVGAVNLPAQMPLHASQLYSRNVHALLMHLVTRTASSSSTSRTRSPRGCLRQAAAVKEAAATEKAAMTGSPLHPVLIYIFMLAVFLGFEVISKVPAHAAHAADVRARTPSTASSWSAAMLVLAEADTGRCSPCSASPPWCSARCNVVGGFVVTDRMLEMFKPKKPAREEGMRSEA